MPLKVFAALFGVIFAASGARAGVLGRNIALMGASRRFPRGLRSLVFRFQLGFCLSFDLLAFLFGRFGAPRMSRRSRATLETLRSGPSLLLCAHFHQWEWQAASLRAAGLDLLGAARPLRARWADRILRGVRRRHGIRVVTDAVPRAALRHLRSGGCFGFLWDQHAPGYPHAGRFFGVPAAMNPLPIFLLEQLLNESAACPVVFGVMLPGGESRLVPLLAPRHFRDGDWRRRLERRYHRVLETLVRRHPARAYGLLHARFKILGPYPGHREGLGT